MAVAQQLAGVGVTTGATVAAVELTAAPGATFLAGAPGGPIGLAISAAAALIMIGIGALSTNSAIKAAKDQAVTVLNQIGAAMETNKQQYLMGPASIETQSNALAMFDQLYDHMIRLLQAFQGSQFQGVRDWATRGLAERMPGGIYDSRAGNRDPIANDPRMAGVTSSLTSIGLSPAGLSETVAELKQTTGLSSTALLGVAAIAGILILKKVT